MVMAIPEMHLLALRKQQLGMPGELPEQPGCASFLGTDAQKVNRLPVKIVAGCQGKGFLSQANWIVIAPICQVYQDQPALNRDRSQAASLMTCSQKSEVSRCLASHGSGTDSILQEIMLPVESPHHLVTRPGSPRCADGWSIGCLSQRSSTGQRRHCCKSCRNAGACWRFPRHPRWP